MRWTKSLRCTMRQEVVNTPENNALVFLTITRQVQTRIGGRHSLDQSSGFGGQTTRVIGQ